MFVNYAHRGASAYYPENTLSAFYAGVHMGANGIETDVRKTKDGVLVLFHDDTLARVTGAKGAVADYTYEQLCELTVRSADGEQVDKIPTLEEFARHFGWRELHFAIELKDEGVEKQTVDLLNAYHMREKTIITSFKFENLIRTRMYAPEYKIGYLYGPQTLDAIEKLRRIDGEQLCPKAEVLTPEMVGELHALGFSVRAWGVKDEALMAHAFRCGVDGMTVNFPDRLKKLLCEQK